MEETIAPRKRRTQELFWYYYEFSLISRILVGFLLSFHRLSVELQW
jgi:hypothetical protein